MFPSPLGVIFSLILSTFCHHNACTKFPSPLGVIFSLIWETEEGDYIVE